MWAGALLWNFVVGMSVFSSAKFYTPDHKWDRYKVVTNHRTM